MYSWMGLMMCSERDGSFYCSSMLQATIHTKVSITLLFDQQDTPTSYHEFHNKGPCHWIDV